MDFFSRKCGVFLLASVISTITLASNSDQTITQEKKEFIAQMVAQDHFSKIKLDHLFQTLHPDPKVIAKMTSPFEKKPWTYYRDFFVTKKRVDLGAQYLKDHHHVLMEMQHKYGIPASVITAIIGVETEYGAQTGVYSVLRTLYTLGFYYPPRETFFRKELAQYLMLARSNHLPVSKLKGSYAGAIGIPQFMPDSYRYFGVSLKKGSPVDLFSNNDDAIASIANYFHKNGWQANQPIARYLGTNDQCSECSLKHQRPRETLLKLPLNDSTQYWETYRNFDVIMSYNHNVVYAMAVYQLSQAIEKQYEINRG